MSRLFPSPPSLTQMRFTQIEADFRTPTTVSQNHLPEPRGLDTRSSYLTQSQTLTQVAAVSSTYPSLSHSLVSKTSRTSPLAPQCKKTAFRPPLRRGPPAFARANTKENQQILPDSKSSDLTFKAYDEGRFVQASDLINATAALYEDLLGFDDDLPDDKIADGFVPGNEPLSEDCNLGTRNINCNPLSGSQKEELKRHPFSTRKSASGEENRKGEDGSSPPMSDFEEDVYLNIDVERGDKSRDLDKDYIGFSRKLDDTTSDDNHHNGNEFDRWLTDIESDLERGYERQLPPSNTANRARDTCGELCFGRLPDDSKNLTQYAATSRVLGDVRRGPSRRDQHLRSNEGRFMNGGKSSSPPDVAAANVREEVGFATRLSDSIRENDSDLRALSSSFGHRGDSANDLVPVSAIPSQFRSLFHFSHFNRVQSKVFPDVFRSSKSLVVSAPTGSGKTVVFELALLRLLSASISGAGDGGSSSIAVYLAPTRALCNEKHEDWNRRFGSLDSFSCHLMTGDSEIDLGSPEFVQQVQPGRVSVVVSTPEKWDMMTRNWRENVNSVRDLKLIMIDEVHHLGDSSRGPTLEAVVSRLKIIDRWSDVSSNRSSIRFVAVSATIPNIEDMAQWLGRDEPAIHHGFGSEFRPVKLRHVVLSYPDQDSKYLFDRNLSYKVNKIVHTYSEGKPSLVFCTTRKMAELSAGEMVKDSRSPSKELEQIGEAQIESDKLRRLLPFGVAYHHAGLSLPDRKTVEALFLRNKLPVLFATSTLATGVNLPAHLVVLKSTFQYATAGYVELNGNQVLQMIGRAGRPQFDKSATVVIMTQHSTKSKYESLLRGKQLIESSFHESLIENLNAEIGLSSINSVDEAVFWLKSTFFFQRFMKDPEKYGFSIETSDPLKVDRELQKLCRTSVKSLAHIDCVLVNDRYEVSSTGTGKLMAKYCIAYGTMKMIYELKGDESMADLLMLLSKSAEFTDVALRQSEKSFLNRLSYKTNPDRIRYPLDTKVKTNYLKVYTVIQAALGGVSFSDISLTQESLMIFKSAPRIAICLMEFLLSKRKDYKLCVHGVYLAKCIKARLWEDSRLTMKQLKGIGDKMAQMLVDAGYSDFETIRKADPRNVEMVLNRAPPFGSLLIERIKRLPSYSLSVSTMDPIQSSKARLRLVVSLSNKDEMTIENSTTGRYHRCALVVGDADNNIVYQRRICDSELIKTGELHYEFKVDRSEKSPELQIHYLSTEFIGLDVWIAVKPIYTDMNGSSGESSNGEASMTSEDLIVTEKTKVVDRPSRKTSKRNVLGPCGHHCANKIICKHECCKIKEDDSALKQQSISRFLKKQNGTELDASKNTTESEDAQGETCCKDFASPEDKVSAPSAGQDDASVSHKLSQRMSKFQFRPLQKVPPMIRDNQNETSPDRNLRAEKSLEKNFPSETIDLVIQDTAVSHTVQSTFNHRRAERRELDSTGLDASWRPSSVSFPERNEGKEEVVEPIDCDSILSPKSCRKRSYPDRLATDSIGAKVSRAPPSAEAVRAWAIPPIEDEILQLQKELTNLRRQQREQMENDKTVAAFRRPSNEAPPQHDHNSTVKEVEAETYPSKTSSQERRPIHETPVKVKTFPSQEARLQSQEPPFYPTNSVEVDACSTEEAVNLVAASTEFEVISNEFSPSTNLSLELRKEVPSISYSWKSAERKVDSISLLKDLDDF